MASGSSGRGNSASKGFDFGSDDILCSYDDYANRDSSSNGNHADPVIAPNSTKDFHKSRMARTSMFPATAYNPPEDSLSQDVIATVEKSMKKYADNLMRFLEGISSRLSQLELYCYNLDKSIGEMRSDLNRDHGEQDSKLKSLEKHLQEVHRSVQILRDKQELAETQKELAKLQLAQKESSSSSHSQSNDERSSPTTDPKKTDNSSDASNQQLALALPHQIAPQPQPPAPPTQAPAPSVTQAPQQPPYYMPPTPLPNPAVAQLPQNQYLASDQQYRTPQLVAPQPTPSQVTPTPPVQQYSQYQQPTQQQQQQQWPQQVQPSQPPPMQSQIRPPSSTVYPPYQPSQAANSSPTETLPNSMPMQMPYSGVPPPGSSRPDAMPYGYGGAGRTVPQQPPPPQQMKGSFPAQPGEMYGTPGTHPSLPPPGSAYMMYDGEGGRATHHPPQPPHFAQAGYPPTSASLQNSPGHNLMVRNPGQSQFVRNHPYNELIEKLVSMGFRGDHVASVIQRMEESGQAIDFNSVLDRLMNNFSV
ncbi:extensin-like isoform X2 [Abrus precatorius]|uniref:Extensin-like isoform X2 n=1 Tax=Abrus precatorius TaxID=3816 RepID=A0A8B8KSI4_ABRPR|nr:extensin-like isoform X2 [Abrus precatorius]